MAYRIQSTIAAAVAALVLTGAGASAQGYSQLAASAGLSPSEAAGMTRAQIAAHFFNRNLGQQEQQTIPGGRAVSVSSRGSAAFARTLGLSPEQARGYSFGQLAAIHYNRGRSPSEQIPVGHATIDYNVDNSQLIAAAGLTPAEARGMALGDIAVRFHNRNLGTDDQIPVGK